MSRPSPLKTNPCPEPTCNKKFTSPEGAAEHAQVVHGKKNEPKKGVDRIDRVEPRCVECGKMGRLVGGEKIYPHRPDLFHKKFYLCVCGAYCGCHPGTILALGYPAGPVTRASRLAAHAAFDKLWRNGTFRRHEAYRWLSKMLQIPSTECHIGMMTAEQADAVVLLVRKMPVVLPVEMENAHDRSEG